LATTDYPILRDLCSLFNLSPQWLSCVDWKKVIWVDLFVVA
jgi:hypothetical protein